MRTLKTTCTIHLSALFFLALAFIGSVTAQSATTGPGNDRTPVHSRTLLPTRQELRPTVPLSELLQTPAEPASNDGTSASPPNHLPATRPDEATSPESTQSSTEASADDQEAVPTTERISELLNAAKQNSALSEEYKQKIAERCQSARDWLKRADESRRRIAELTLEIEQGPERLRETKQQLAEAIPDVPNLDLESQSINELKTKVLEAQNQVQQATEKLAARENELEGRSERKTELVQQLAEIKQHLAEIDKALQLEAPADDPVELVRARRADLQARAYALRLANQQHKLQIQRFDALNDYFPLARDLANRNLKVAQQHLAALQQAIAAARQAESENQAKRARQDVRSSLPVVRGLAERNAELAEMRRKLSGEMTQVSQEIVALKSHLQELQRDEAKARQRVEKAGHSTIVGLMLRRQREQLPSLSHSQRRLRFVASRTPEINSLSLELADERSDLADLDAAVRKVVLDVAPEQVNESGSRLHREIRDILIPRRELLDSLIADLDNYLFSLGELEINHQELARRIQSFETFIDENVLWIRSSARLSIAHLREASSGIGNLISPDRWLPTVGQILLDTSTIAIGFLIVALLVLQKRIRRQIADLCQSRANTAGARFAPSVQALLLTWLLTAGWPVMIWYVGWRMSASDPTNQLAMSFGPALQYVAAVLWISLFFQALCRRHGVAESFFDWYPSGLTTARRALRWLTLAGLPLLAITVVCRIYQDGHWNDSLGRLAFTTVTLLAVPFTHVTLGSKNHVFREAVARASTRWLNRIRVGSYLAGMGISLTLAGLAAMGYYYSALQLAARFQGTLVLAFACLLIHAVAARWFVVTRRRLVVQQAKERVQQVTEEPEETSRSLPSVTVEESPDWSLVHQRLQILLRHAITVCLLLGAWFIWADVLPALRVLDNVELWSYIAERQERTISQDGTDQGTITVYENVDTTLRHLLIAAATLLATFVLGKNLPALLEITMLNRLPLDRGGRHAVAIVLHYAVALSGVLSACRTLHIQWSSVQWLAAGMTVGLGFGLQEIFANFFSGIILLFERPIRVGDIITLDDVTGMVTDIRIRATTVTNWDRKELVVPNKDLITGRLLNWTLSDTTNRVVIEVGIAYKSDASQARHIMLETVRRHNNVLENPAPIVTFESFGNSALNFVIRVYLSSLDVRLETIHELHVQLHRSLTQSGIEIAFPQRDLNIRHVAWPASTMPDREAA